MRRLLLPFMLILLCIPQEMNAQIYAAPEGGWTYIFEGDAADSSTAAALDGTWDHENGSDAWDGTAPGDGLPGGIGTYTSDDGTTFLRIQDPGDPRDQLGVEDPSNRKVYPVHRTAGDSQEEDSSFVDDGVTLSFRIRLATEVTGPIDFQYPDGGGEDFWRETGDGYVIHDRGKGNVTIRQATGGAIGFTLAYPWDEEDDNDDYLDVTGMLTNKLNGNEVIDDVGYQEEKTEDAGGAGTLNHLELDSLDHWHDFWITIQKDESGFGTHVVNIYHDGSTDPVEYIVTAGTANIIHEDTSYIAIGHGATPQVGATDFDYVAYRIGVHEPTTATSINQQRDALPDEYHLAQNFPNPFNPRTVIKYSIPRDMDVEMTVFNLRGEKVATLVNEQRTAGEHQVTFDGSTLESGVYLYRMSAGGHTLTKKLTLIK